MGHSERERAAWGANSPESPSQGTRARGSRLSVPVSPPGRSPLPKGRRRELLGRARTARTALDPPAAPGGGGRGPRRAALRAAHQAKPAALRQQPQSARPAAGEMERGTQGGDSVGSDGSGHLNGFSKLPANATPSEIGHSEREHAVWGLAPQRGQKTVRLSVDVSAEHDDTEAQTENGGGDVIVVTELARTAATGANVVVDAARSVVPPPRAPLGASLLSAGADPDIAAVARQADWVQQMAERWVAEQRRRELERLLSQAGGGWACATDDTIDSTYTIDSLTQSYQQAGESIRWGHRPATARSSTGCPSSQPPGQSGARGLASRDAQTPPPPSEAPSEALSEAGRSPSLASPLPSMLPSAAMDPATFGSVVAPVALGRESHDELADLIDLAWRRLGALRGQAIATRSAITFERRSATTAAVWRREVMHGVEF